MVANLPKMAKPVIDGEETSMRTRQTIRGGWGERASKDRSRNLGGPAWCPEAQGAKRTTAMGNP